MEKQRNDRKEQKQVNQSCTYMKHQETACPQKQQNKKQCYEHDAFLLGRNAGPQPLLVDIGETTIPRQTCSLRSTCCIAGFKQL
jgi:hypothetical protein